MTESWQLIEFDEKVFDMTPLTPTTSSTIQINWQKLTFGATLSRGANHHQFICHTNPKGFEDGRVKDKDETFQGKQNTLKRAKTFKDQD